MADVDINFPTAGTGWLKCRRALPESDIGVDLDMPLSRIVARLVVERIVENDEERLITAMVVDVNTGVRLQGLQHCLFNSRTV